MSFLRKYFRFLREHAFNAEVLSARVSRFAYLLKEGWYRGERSYAIIDKQGLRLLGTGIPVMQGVYQNYRVWWERKVQQVRWIETRGCDAADHKVLKGHVVKEFVNTNKHEPYLEIRLENGDALFFPKRAFYVAPDGVLEYRY